MKICWDNLDGLTYSKRVNKWVKKYPSGNYVYFKYVDICKNCKEPFLIDTRKKGIFCSNKCFHNFGRDKNYKNNISKSKIGVYKGKNNPNYENGNKISGIKNCNWKGGYNKKKIPLYNTYISQLNWCEPVKRNEFDINILEVKCAYCGKWYIPTQSEVITRLKVLNSKSVGDCKFYCSTECKTECPTYRQHKWPKDFKLATSREVQPELRQMVLKRDTYTCQKCGSKKSLHCHHLEGILWEPLESADIDKCITLCKTCHIKVHKLPDCGYNDLKCKN